MMRKIVKDENIVRSTSQLHTALDAAKISQPFCQRPMIDAQISTDFISGECVGNIMATIDRN